jgi:HEAT repeat protein
MGQLRRIFTAPGNPRIWLSLAIYITALAVILIYRTRIGEVVSNAFRTITEPTPAPAPKPPPKVDQAMVAVKQALALPPAERDRELLALARAGNRPALLELQKIVAARPKDAAPSEPLVRSARAAVSEGTRALRQAAAGILLWAEKLPARRATANKLAAELGGKVSPTRRLQILRRLGLLGLAGVRDGQSEGAVLRALRGPSADVRAAAARALGRMGDPGSRETLLRLVSDKEPAVVREAALAGLIDLGLAQETTRSEVLRNLAARLAVRDLSAELAEHVWRSLRQLAGTRASSPSRQK